MPAQGTGVRALPDRLSISPPSILMYRRQYVRRYGTHDLRCRRSLYKQEKGENQAKVRSNSRRKPSRQEHNIRSTISDPSGSSLRLTLPFLPFPWVVRTHEFDER